MGFGGVSRGVLIALAACVVALVAPAAASANTYYASPAGGFAACSPGEPCKVEVALGKAKDGEAVFLAPGTYTLPIGGLQITEDIDFGATPSAKAVLLTTSTTYGLTVDPGVKAHVHDVVLNGDVGITDRAGIGRRTGLCRIHRPGRGPPRTAGRLRRSKTAPFCATASAGRRSAKEEANSSSANGVLATFGPTCGPGPKQTVVLRNVTAITSTATGHGLRRLRRLQLRRLDRRCERT